MLDARPANQHSLPFAGTWEVTQAAVDAKDQQHWIYKPDDPRLVGRALNFAPSKFTFNDGSSPCIGASWVASKRNTLGALIATMFSRPLHLGIPRHPTIADFGLPLRDRPVTPLAAVCSSPGANHAEHWLNALFIGVADNEMLMTYGSGTILVLKRVVEGAEPMPSFACGGAKTKSESAICSSSALAGWDRSVAAAFNRSLKVLTAESEKEAARKEQREWLHHRDACEDDVMCLETRMRDRVDALMW